MENNQQRQTPSFLKLYHGDSDDKLKIPDSFVDQHGRNLSGKLVLMSSHGSPVVVSVERSSSGRGRQGFFFKLGWADFVEQNRVEEGDFLVFNFTGDRTVNVVVYDSSGCVKGLELKKQQVGSFTQKKRFRNGDDDEETEHASVPRKEKRVVKRVKRESPELHSSGKACGLAKSAYFQVDYKKYMKYGLCIPKEFCEAAELSAGDKAQLQDPSGEVWSVVIISGDRSGRQLRLSAGWPGFVTANGLGVGHGLEFCFKAELGLIQVMIDRKKKKVKIDRKKKKMVVGDGLHWERIVVID